MRKILFVAVPVMMAGLFAMPGKAEAKKSGGFIQYGDIVLEAGELPKPYKDMPKLMTLKAGYKCKVLAVMWAHMHKWGCEPVAVRGIEYFAPENQSTAEDRKLLSEVNTAIGKKYSMSDVKLNAWNKHGRILIILAILGLVGYGVWNQMNKGKKKKDKKKDA